jgi:hypothetical protein
VLRLGIAGLVALLECDDATAPRGLGELDSATSPIRFKSLRVGDELRVRSHSQGCFHDRTALIEFTPTADGGATVYAVAVARESAFPGFASGSLAQAITRRLNRREIRRSMRAIALRLIAFWPTTVPLTPWAERRWTPWCSHCDTMVMWWRNCASTVGYTRPPALPSRSAGLPFALSDRC